MDAIRVTKVEHVKCTKAGSSSMGTLHLTAHHLIFRYDEGAQEEMWVPYPLISLVMRLPQTLQGQCPLTFYTRTFETFSLSFSKEGDAIDVFDSVRELTVSTSVSQLYAFFYSPNPPLASTDGWSIYSPREEFRRMGVGSRTLAWRFTDINKDYAFSPTYPSRLVIPTRISDTTLQYAAKYRSKCRIPALTYLHWAHYGTITRSSQPMVGITQNRSIQDEKLVESIFQSHFSPDSRASNVRVYGATSTNLIIDARPTANAVANTAKGAGTENMDHYRDGKKVYLGIDHIHVMRESLAKVVEALREAENAALGVAGQLADDTLPQGFLDRQALRRSGWLRHISAILEGSVLIARNVHVNSSHVLIHCSDGWDRTSQLSALSQILLDPFYRTMRGFQILIEKDWLSFGYRFLDRCGHLSSEKFFVSPAETFNTGGGAEAAQAFLASVQQRFASQHHIKETSPIFHQFLEAVRQVQRQFPERFEFNQRFLKQLYYHLYSCQFGTFLYNCERERRVGDGGPPPCELTVSVWDHFNSPTEREKNMNESYDPSLDDPASRLPNADMGVLFPNTKDVRFWHELYGKNDEEMNGRIRATQSMSADLAVAGEGIDSDSVTPLTSTPSMTPLPLPPSPARSPNPALPPVSPQSGSISPAVGTAIKEMSTSLPDVASKTVRDSSAMSASTSALPTQRRGTLPRATTTPPPPSRSRTNMQADFLSSSGVMSMWGKLSSNASAAFSVVQDAVQDAYSGVGKDVKTREGEKTSELRSRESLSAWGEEERTGPLATTSTYAVEASVNPWATSRTRAPPTSLPSENPWSSVRAPPPVPVKETSPIGGLFETKPYPSDPHLPSALVSAESSRLSSLQNDGPQRQPPREESALKTDGDTGMLMQRDDGPPRHGDAPTPRPPAVTNTDPLGVGLL